MHTNLTLKKVQSCNVQKNCHPYAECLHEERTNRHFCKCKPGKIHMN